MSKDSARLSRLGVLAPAALSACMDASMMTVPAAGAIVSTVLNELSKAFMLKKWFHGSMTAKEAEHLMMEKGKNGSFLVRESKAHPGDFVLSVRVRGRVSHVMIRKQHNKYNVGSGEQFDDLVGLIEHFRSYPMIESSGDVLRLLQPVGGTKLRSKETEHKTPDIQDMDDVQDIENNCGLDNEFLSLQLMENPNGYSVIEGSRPENACKNRYRNIIPYDETRVVLRRKDEGPGCDYINASFITSSTICDSSSSVQSSTESLDSIRSLVVRKETKRKLIPLVSKSLSDEALKEVKRCFKLDKLNGNAARQKTYIATQGCLPNTKDDFWRMIWQEDVRAIVMITNGVEKGKEAPPQERQLDALYQQILLKARDKLKKKCERYWPKKTKEETYRNLTVRSITKTHYEDYAVREFDVTDDKNNCRTIYQYQFTGWPDHGIPMKPDSLLTFIADINRRLSLIRQSNNPPERNIVCVHCSAGVGRTGTFIVLDMLIDKIKAFGFTADLDVRDTVKQVRAQRSGMVQNKSQYKFIYSALQHYEKLPPKYNNKVYSLDL